MSSPNDDEIIFHDVLIVGAGLSGLRTAIELADHANVAILSKVHPLRSHSGAAQGGVNAALRTADPNDTWEAHAFDTVKGSPSKINIERSKFSLNLINSSNNLPSFMESLKSWADFLSIPVLCDIM